MMSYANYRLLIPMPRHIVDGVARYKRASAKYIGDFQSLTSPAHISIIQKYRCKPYVVESSFGRIEKKLQAMPPLVGSITGFNYFNHGDAQFTIYAQLKTTDSITCWFRLLFENLNEKHKGFTAHITIARAISRKQFDILWPFFKQLNYTDDFTADHIKISKMDTYFGNEWSAFRDIYFLNRLSI